MLRGIIFDMDGLMIDTEKLLTRFWCEAANFYGYPMTDKHVLGIRSLAAKYAMPHLKSIFGEDFDYWAVRAKRIELMNSYIKEYGVEKKKGLDELLEYLKTTDLKLAVATATDMERTKMYLDSIHIFDIFDRIICGNMIENGNPLRTFTLPPLKNSVFRPATALLWRTPPMGFAPPMTQAVSL